MLSSLDLRCPAPSQTLAETLKLLNDAEQLQTKTVTSMVERDPVVVARLLQLANSAYYGLRRSVTSVERAVVMLGPVAVAGILVSMNMLKLRTVLTGADRACFDRLIRHSTATAFLARYLEMQFPDESIDDSATATRPKDIFTAGLLHDFGKIILVYNFSNKATAFYEEQILSRHVTDTDLRELEQLLFGCDHTEAGEYAARKLHFPDFVTEIIRTHHEPDCTTTSTLTCLVAAANLAAKAMGHAFTQPCTWKECAAADIWTQLCQHAPGAVNPEDLLRDLKAQQAPLEAYVGALLTPTT
jgi:HD-like signal output (HDOD) protein